MLHRLALALGRTVGEIETTMSAREFADWHTFGLTHPLPFELVDIHAGQLCALLFNVNRAKGVAAAAPADFMVLSRKPEAKPQGSIAQRMKAIAEGGG